MTPSGSLYFPHQRASRLFCYEITLGRMLKAGDRERENVVKGGNWRHEDDVRIDVVEQCGK